MIKKRIFLVFILFIACVTFIAVFQYKENTYKKKIIKELLANVNGDYALTGDLAQIDKKRYFLLSSEMIPQGCKLIYEINFGCSVCLMELKEAYNLYQRMSRIKKIDFVLISNEKSFSFIKYFLDKILDSYNMWMIRQNSLDPNIKLYLVDYNNKIIFAGSILKYPFLKKEYIKRVKKV